jgi:hypothetical protein
MKRVVRMPGPSSPEARDIEKISPLVSDSLSILLASADLKILMIQRQVDKVSVVTSYPYLQIPILFRLLLCRPQLRTIVYRNTEEVPSSLQKRPDESFEVQQEIGSGFHAEIQDTAAVQLV